MNDLKKHIDSLKGDLPIDDKTILNNEFVRKEMESQWDAKTDITINTLNDREDIWQNILGHMHVNKDSRVLRFLRIYGIAATVLLAITAGSFFFTQRAVKESLVYVVCTGKQDEDVLTLNDGTKIKLRAGSKLTYPDEFPSDHRKVKLQGQAFFNVAKDEKKPFSIEISNVVITAIGTSFEIFEDKNNGSVETILLNGKVRIDYKDISTGETKSNMLYPNQKLTVYLASGEVNVQSENADQYSAWRNYNGLDFTNEKLSVIIPRLEYWYGCRIVYESADILNEKFSFKIKNESLDRILSLMGQTSPIVFDKDKESTLYTLRRK